VFEDDVGAGAVASDFEQCDVDFQSRPGFVPGVGRSTVLQTRFIGVYVPMDFCFPWFAMTECEGQESVAVAGDVGIPRLEAAFVDSPVRTCRDYFT
jgi:hypothetical protein